MAGIGKYTHIIKRDGSDVDVDYRDYLSRRLETTGGYGMTDEHARSNNSQHLKLNHIQYVQKGQTDYKRQSKSNKKNVKVGKSINDVDEEEDVLEMDNVSKNKDSTIWIVR